MARDANRHEAGPDRDGELRIVVAALTRRRPLMLRDLLISWGEMDIPDNCTVSCLIVENDDTDGSRSLVENISPLPNGLAIEHVLETEPGIPFGRNRAAREAIARDADLLAFVDDDEVVAEDWLVELVGGYRNSEAVLLGGPVYVENPKQDLSRIERIIHSNLVDRYRQRARHANKLATRGNANDILIATGNWLAETSLFTSDSIWFDERMRYSGGTDAKLWRDTIAKNLGVGWISSAHVFETIPRQRLSLSYQFARARDQSATHFHLKAKQHRFNYLRLLLSVLLKGLAAAFLLISIPLTGGKTLLQFTHTSGWIIGRLSAALGYRSSLYVSTTGH